MNPSDIPAAKPRGVVPRPHRFVRRLTWLYASCVLIVAAGLSTALLPSGLLQRSTQLAVETIVGGVGALTLCALLLSLTGLIATLLLTTARHQTPRNAWLQRLTPGVAARQGQAVIVTLGAIAICIAAWRLAPNAALGTVPANANLAAALVFVLAFLSLVAERSMHGFPAQLLPEAPSLRRLLLLTTVLLVVAACIELGRGAGLNWLRWPTVIVLCLPCLVAIELAGRALARLFLPAPAAEAATAVTQSVVASLLTGGPRAPAVLLRTHLGLDFTRSWALSYLSAAALPALLLTAAFCWGLSGVKLIDLGDRGIYERLGAPVGVLGPGIHLLLPWPLGRLRPVEYGTIHSVPIGVDQSQPENDEQMVDAEALPPLSLNRLWESSHAGQAQYLVPSASTGQQGFQTVSTEISVLYRVGLSDEAALQSVYSVADPEALIKDAASRLVLRYFNSRTLETVLYARRENIAESLRDALSADLNSRRAGIDIVSVLIEEIHPPAGAAAAYHAVQAAEINASASISDEKGRAERTAGIAQQESHQLIAAATAHSAELREAASGDAYRFNAERRAYGDGGQSFILERQLADLKSALAQTPLTLLDHRLSAAQIPVMDMRGIGAAAAPPTAPAPPAATPAPVNPDVDTR